MSTILVTYYITPPGYIERDEYDLAWASVDPGNSTSRKDFFSETYNMVAGVVEIEPEVFIDVYFFTGSWWPAVFQLFSTTDPACPQPCALVRFPE